MAGPSHHGCAGTWWFLLLQAILLGGLLPSPLLLLLLPCTSAEQVLIPAGDALSTIHAGQQLEHLAYKFKMQTDCNLVLYDGGTAIWASDTTGKGVGSCSATITSDGYLVIRDGKGREVWKSTKSDLGSNYMLALQPDRNVVIYSKPVWATGTFIPHPPSQAAKEEAAASSGRMRGAAGAGRNVVPSNGGV